MAIPPRMAMITVYYFKRNFIRPIYTIFNMIKSHISLSIKVPSLPEKKSPKYSTVLFEKINDEINITEEQNSIPKEQINVRVFRGDLPSKNKFRTNPRRCAIKRAV